MELERAREIAEKVKELLEGGYMRCEIVGSVRRLKPFPNDIELLCIPKFRGTANLLKQESSIVDLLDQELKGLIGTHFLDYRHNKKGSIVYGPKNKLLRHVESGIGVDIFSSTETNWGMALLVRTGPKEWNIRVMSRLRELGMQGHAYGGISADDGKEINCPDEETVFRCLGWADVPPDRRR